MLMAWCFSTRASVATVLTMHPCVSRCLGDKDFFVRSWAIRRWFSQFHEWGKITAESPHEWPKNCYSWQPILFLTCSYLVYNTGKCWKLSATHRLFAMGLSIAVLWCHTNKYCDVILNDCPQNVSKGAQAFSCCYQVDYHSLIIKQD